MTTTAHTIHTMKVAMPPRVEVSFPFAELEQRGEFWFVGDVRIGAISAEAAESAVRNWEQANTRMVAAREKVTANAAAARSEFGKFERAHMDPSTLAGGIEEISAHVFSAVQEEDPTAVLYLLLNDDDSRALSVVTALAAPGALIDHHAKSLQALAQASEKSWGKSLLPVTLSGPDALAAVLGEQVPSLSDRSVLWTQPTCYLGSFRSGDRNVIKMRAESFLEACIATFRRLA